jgi:hypothetical protein
MPSTDHAMSQQSPSVPKFRLVIPPLADDTAGTEFNAAAASTGKPRPKLFRALGNTEPPPQVEIGGTPYDRVEVLKHDSWAATAVYRSSRETIICKFNRQQRIGPLPMRWLGRRLAARENYLLRRLADLPNVPAYRGPIAVAGRPTDNVAAHVFVEGHPLRKGDPVDRQFFEQLQHTLQAMHARGIAYVDLHKGENILVGDDARSYLIDFQVCYIRPRNRLLARLLLRAERTLQHMDLYHLRKHLCVHRPDISGCTIQQLKQRNDRPFWIKAHRAVAVPLRTLRRRMLVMLGIRKGEGKATSEHFAEDAVRRQLEPSTSYAAAGTQRRAA